MNSLKRKLRVHPRLLTSALYHILLRPFLNKHDSLFVFFTRRWSLAMPFHYKILMFHLRRQALQVSTDETKYMLSYVPLFLVSQLSYIYVIPLQKLLIQFNKIHSNSHYTNIIHGLVMLIDDKDKNYYFFHYKEGVLFVVVVATVNLPQQYPAEKEHAQTNS